MNSQLIYSVSRILFPDMWLQNQEVHTMCSCVRSGEYGRWIISQKLSRASSMSVCSAKCPGALPWWLNYILSIFHSVYWSIFVLNVSSLRCLLTTSLTSLIKALPFFFDLPLYLSVCWGFLFHKYMCTQITYLNMIIHINTLTWHCFKIQWHVIIILIWKQTLCC